MKRFGFLSLFFSHAFFLPAQTVSDSLRSVIRSDAPDTSKAKAMNLLCDQLWLTGEYTLSHQYADSAMRLSRKYGLKKEIARAWFNKSKAVSETGEYVLALRYADSAMVIYQECKDLKGIAMVYNTKGRINSTQANYPEALKNYLASLKLKIEDGDKKGIGVGYNNIGNVFFNQGNNTEALKNHLQALAIREEIGDKSGMASSYHNIANIYNMEGKYSEALDYYEKALAINTAIGKKSWMSHNRIGIGEVYENMKEYDKALGSYLIGLKIKKDIGEKNGIASAWVSVAKALTALKKFEKPKAYLDSALKMSKEIGSHDVVRDCYSALANLAYVQGSYKEAYDYYRLFSAEKDSLINKENLKNIAMLNAQFDVERKDNEIKLLNKEKEAQTELSLAENRRKNIILWSVAGILALVIVFSFIIYNRLQFSDAQKTVIEKQQKNILDSIRYAKLIQKSVIPSEAEVLSLLPFDAFVLFQPKDIVSGDFYWVSSVKQNNTEKYVIAVGDCTGHGVPGAFLTLMGSMLMNEIINDKNILEPAQVLKHLHKGVTGTLSHSRDNQAVGDGMDISICIIDRDRRTLTYAGAMHPVYFIHSSDAQMASLKPDTISIGGAVRYSGQAEVEFTQHSITLGKETAIYLFSDGYIDQFSKESKMRFGSRRFKDLLQQNAKLPMADQKKNIQEALAAWKGSRTQLDDILVMGIKI